jgi:type IV pilus secretin PilQ/predicted competence protein
MVSRTIHFRKVISIALCGIAVIMLSSMSNATTENSLENRTLVSRLEVRSTGTGEEVWIIGNQPLAHSAFLLSDPFRLVVDIPDAVLAMDTSDLSGDYRFIDRVTSRHFAEANREVVRIELIMKEEHPYTITSSDTGLKIAFGEVRVGSVTESADTEWNVPEPVGTGEDFIDATHVYGLQEPTVYRGKPIFLDLKDADILDIFRLIAEVSGFNVVVDPDVSGRITLRMDNVPWDQALEVILKNQGLGKEIEGNIMRIAYTAKLRDEHTLRMQLEDAKRRALPIESVILYLSYANINDMESACRAFLTERGSIMRDTRVNALIVRDIRSALDNVTEMVRVLDVRTRAVSINSQIVVTSKNFTRDLGIQWGGRFFADAEHGNTTGYQFPNNFSVNMTTGDDPDESKYAVNFPTGTQMMAMTFGNVTDTLRLNIALRASESEGIVKTIARPTVTTLNNETATISSGDKIPYLNTTSMEGATVMFQDANTSLNVTPNITNDNWINLAVNVTRDFPGYNTPAGPAIITNSANTKVLINNGDTLVIGGLNQSQQSFSNQRIPWFGKLPIIGWLFKDDSRTTSFSDLLFFITPRILAEQEQVIRSETF